MTVESPMSVAEADKESSTYLSSREEYLGVDEILQRYVGQFGKAQIWQFVLVSLAWILEGQITMVTIFADHVPDLLCVLQNSNATRVCIPTANICDTNLASVATALAPGASTVSEWKLFCGDEYKVGLVGSLFFVGGLLGDGLYGSLSDCMLGRKGALAMACIMTSILAILTSCATNYWVYLVLRFLTGLNAGGIGLCSLVLGTELVGPKCRESVGMRAFYFFSFGVMILPALAYISALSWRTLYFSIAAMGVCYCALVLPSLCESPHWFLVHGRADEALGVLRALAKDNGSCVPQFVRLTAPFEDFEDGHPWVRAREQAEKSRVLEGAKATVREMFRSEETRTTMLLMAGVWFSVGIAYFGIILNVGNVNFNLYLFVFLNGLVEVPSFVVPALMLKKWGKRFILVSFLCLSGVCCLIGSLLYCVHGSGDRDPIASRSNHVLAVDPSGSPTGFDAVLVAMRAVCGLAGLFGLGAAYNLLYIYTLELFPTVVRNGAMGVISQFANVGSVLAPLAVTLGRRSRSAPMLLFGIFSLLGAAAGLGLPDHLDPETSSSEV